MSAHTDRIYLRSKPIGGSACVSGADDVHWYALSMPYEINFVKVLSPDDPEVYINDCCWGGDIVRDRLLAPIEAKFEVLQTFQEDWGWSIWCCTRTGRLAVDIFCADREAGKYTVKLSERTARFLLPDSVSDGPDLDRLVEVIKVQLEFWGVQVVGIDRAMDL